jgi:hypothetical protein
MGTAMSSWALTGYDNGETNEGAAFIYHGSAAGINTTAAAMVETNQANAKMGLSVAGAGDVNGDGYSDVIVGAFCTTTEKPMKVPPLPTMVRHRGSIPRQLLCWKAIRQLHLWAGP